MPTVSADEIGGKGRRIPQTKNDENDETSPRSGAILRPSFVLRPVRCEPAIRHFQRVVVLVEFKKR